MTDFEHAALQPETAEATPVAPNIETPDETLVVLGIEAEGAGQWLLAWRRLRRHRLAMASLVLLVLIGLLTVFAGFIATRGFSAQELSKQLLRPSHSYIFGTDTLG